MGCEGSTCAACAGDSVWSQEYVESVDGSEIMTDSDLHSCRFSVDDTVSVGSLHRRLKKMEGWGIGKRAPSDGSEKEEPNSSKRAAIYKNRVSKATVACRIHQIDEAELDRLNAPLSRKTRNQLLGWLSAVHEVLYASDRAGEIRPLPSDDFYDPLDQEEFLLRQQEEEQQQQQFHPLLSSSRSTSASAMMSGEGTSREGISSGSALPVLRQQRSSQGGGNSSLFSLQTSGIAASYEIAASSSRGANHNHIHNHSSRSRSPGTVTNGGISGQETPPSLGGSLSERPHGHRSRSSTLITSKGVHSGNLGLGGTHLPSASSPYSPSPQRVGGSNGGGQSSSLNGSAGPPLLNSPPEQTHSTITTPTCSGMTSGPPTSTHLVAVAGGRNGSQLTTVNNSFGSSAATQQTVVERVVGAGSSGSSGGDGAVSSNENDRHQAPNGQSAAAKYFPSATSPAYFVEKNCDANAQGVPEGEVDEYSEAEFSRDGNGYGSRHFGDDSTKAPSSSRQRLKRQDEKVVLVDGKDKRQQQQDVNAGGPAAIPGAVES